MGAGKVKQSRKRYEQLFVSYPDVVTLVQFCEMLGGISDKTARKLIRQNRVQHYCIRHAFLIPKTWVIDYVLSDHYVVYKRCLKAQV
jgi:hypothetical protein